VATSRLLASRLGLAPESVIIAFQSRLGRTPWIRPYTDQVLAALPRQGVRRVAVFSPSFVADCLETLEEIGIRGRDTFLQAGGESLELVPSLNAGSPWVETAVDLVREALR
jgi:ferrochelatase